jgi:hypothetical protein
MINEEQFWAFSPLANHLDNQAAMDGYMFETYGKDLAFVLEQPVQNVWTIIERRSKLYALSGCQLDALGYFVTRQPWAKKTTALLT